MQQFRQTSARAESGFLMACVRWQLCSSWRAMVCEGHFGPSCGALHAGCQFPEERQVWRRPILYSQRLPDRTSTSCGQHHIAFLQERFLRITPAYYVILTLACCGVFPSFPERPCDVWGLRYFYHLLYLQDVFYPDIAPVFWSLAVECQFYILAPFLVGGLLLVNRQERYVLFAMAAALSVFIKAWAALRWFPHGTDDWETYYWVMQEHFPFRLDGFIAGMLGAFLWQDEYARRLLRHPMVANALFWSGLVIFIALTGFVTHIDIHVGLFDEIFLTPLLSVAFGAMMLGLLGGCYGHRVFTAQPLRFIALISYSLYLIHTILIPTCENAVLAAMPGIRPSLQWLVFLIMYVCLSVLVSTVLFLLLKNPVLHGPRRQSTRRNGESEFWTPKWG